MVSELIRDHFKILAQMKVVIGHAQSAEDEGTLDMMGGYIRELEKFSWMLSAWSKESREQLDTSMIKS